MVLRRQSPILNRGPGNFIVHLTFPKLEKPLQGSLAGL